VSRAVSLQRFASSDPGNLALVLDCADALLDEGQAAAAAELLAATRQHHAGQPGFGFRVARTALAQGRYADAIAELDALLAAGHAVPAVIHDLAFAELCAGDAEGALARIRTLADGPGPSGEQHAPLPAAALLAARCLHMLGRLDEAQEALAPVLASPATAGPVAADAFGLLALLRFDAQRFDDVVAPATEALALDPQQHEALLALGTLALLQGRTADAEPLFLLALQRFPTSGRALSGAGQAFLARGEMAAAETMLERAVRALPGHIGTWHAYAWCALLAGRVDEAQRCYESALAIDRTFGDTHGGFALVHALRGEAAEAGEAAKRSLRLAPGNALAVYAECVLLDDAGRQDEADRRLQALLGHLPQGAPADIRAFATALRARLAGQA
jgi:tetratricopeptide (TPR) repeat protein